MVERKSVKTHFENVLYLSFDGLTDPLGQSQVLPYLCGLSRDYSITIVSFEKSDRFQAGRGVVDKICNTHGIRWIPLTYHTKPPIFCTLYDLWRLQQLIKKLHYQINFKIVHCRSYVTSLIGLWMKHNYKVKFIFDMRGFWADERVDGRLWNLKNPVFKIIYKYFKAKEKQFIKEADAIVSLTENAKSEILKWNLNPSIHVIPCCVDLDHFNNALIDGSKKSTLRNKLDIKIDEFVLLYVGSLGTWYLVDEMLDFFRVLKKNKSNARFLIITPDELSLQHYEHSHDVILLSATRDEMPLYISLATASIIFIKPTFSKKASSATKLAEVLAMGIPIIVNNGWGDVERIMNDKQAGILINKLTTENYVKSVEKLIAFVESGEREFEFNMTDFSLQNGVKAYRDIYESIAIL